MEVANPGEACRIGVVFDIIEPRIKEPGEGSDYPGILGPIATAGQGTTHVLRGAAVTVVDEAAPLGNSKIVEMSGPASEESPYSVLHHLAIVPHIDPNLERHTAQNALRLASVKTSVYLAKTALGKSPDATEVFQSDGPTQAGRDGLKPVRRNRGRRLDHKIDTGTPQNPVGRGSPRRSPRRVVSPRRWTPLGRRDSNARLQTAGVAPRQVPPVCPERALGCRNSHGESASDSEPATTQNRRESARERSFAGPGVGTDRYNRRCPR